MRKALLGSLAVLLLVAFMLGASPIRSEAEMTVIWPNGGEILCTRMSYELKWQDTGIHQEVTIQVHNNGSIRKWALYPTRVPNTGSYWWTIPDDDWVLGSSWYFAVGVPFSTDPDDSDISDDPFSIIEYSLENCPHVVVP